ncbi:hypothetical protein FOHLNKBM_4528 [Methylobacterium longum]|nr:hypothetical protein FOHLNKBM_4528 [Methylobacterium longum]
MPVRHLPPSVPFRRPPDPRGAKRAQRGSLNARLNTRLRGPARWPAGFDRTLRP